MELKVNEIQLPEVIQFNYDELKAELTDKVKTYETMVYSDDQIKLAKSDRANLNKLKKALNDERIRREREYMKPFEDFKAKINEIIGIIDKPVALIDKQVKEYEELQKEAKSKEIEKIFYEIERPLWLDLNQIFNSKWLNSSVSISAIEKELTERVDAILRDLETLSDLPEYGFEATEIYKKSLDLNSALSEGRRLAEIQRKKEEAERARKEAELLKLSETNAKQIELPLSSQSPDFMNPPVEDAPEATWINFSAKLTVSQAMELKGFFKARKIEFKAI